MKVVLITGGSSGFGKAMAQELVKQAGYRVYCTVRQETSPIPGVSYLSMDVRSQDSVEQAVGALLEKEGCIHVLINNAGIGIAGPLELTGIKEVQDQMDVNFFGVVRLTQAVMPHMRNQKDGLIINISSIGGSIGLPYQGYYSASKFAVTGFSQALYLEAKQFNIRVVSIHPGDFATQFTKNRNFPNNDKIMQIYPGFFEKTMPKIESDEQNGLNPAVLAKKIARIIRKKNPAPSYTIARWDQKASVMLKRLLPERLFLKIIEMYYL